jgi:putative nucleotidyltransferase with HDIG domain
MPEVIATPESLTEPERVEHVLVVDDEETVRGMLGEALAEEGLQASVVATVAEARRKLESQAFDLVIADIVMPKETGIDLLAWCRERDPDLPFVVMTGFSETEHVVEALNLGAQSFLRKPFALDELQNTVCNTLAKRRFERVQQNLRQHLEETNTELRQRVVDAVVEHEALFLGCLQALAQTIDARDPYTQQHSASVSRLARHLAREMKLSREQQHAAEVAGALHDIGKIGVPETILLKPARLTDEEMDVMRQHPARAADILDPVPGLDEAIPAIRAHHEQVDGLGYPRGLGGQEIPLLARVLSVCDTWDAMTSDRPYRKAMPVGKARQILQEVRGSQLDGEVVDVFLSNVVPPASERKPVSERLISRGGA